MLVEYVLPCEKIIEEEATLSDKDTSPMSQAALTISSKNYSSWSLRGWLLCRMAGLDFAEVLVEMDDEARQELLLLSPSVLVPRLTHDDVTVWDTLAIAEYLHEVTPAAGLWPAERAARAAAGRSRARCIRVSITCVRHCR